MTIIVVDKVLSERSYGVIFSGTVTDAAGLSQKISVRANFTILTGLPAVGETWEIDGHIRPTVYGQQLTAISGRRLLPSGHLIRVFLANQVPGIGHVRASRLWQAYGEGLPTVLSSNEMIEAVAHVLAPDRPFFGRQLASLVCSAWQAAEHETKVLAWLDRQGVNDPGMVRRLQRVLGSNALHALKENPYIMVPLLAWEAMDELGRRILRESGHDPLVDKRRYVGSADEAVKRMLQRGDTAAPIDCYRVTIAQLLSLTTSSSLLDQVLSTAVANGAIILDDGFARAPGAASLEDDLVKRFSLLSKTEQVGRVTADRASKWSELFANIGGSAFALSVEQQVAVKDVVSRPLACLVGAGGTGKTQTCKVICDLWQQFGGDVLLCALSGKAALRLARSTGRRAITFARMIGELAERDRIEAGIDPTPEHPDKSKVAERLARLSRLSERTLVVVDEASMVDLPMMHSIARRLPSGAQLLLVGDDGQLPPIGFGLVFHKLVDDPTITSRLTQVHRQSAKSGLPAAAAYVRMGARPEMSPFVGQSCGISFVHADVDSLAQIVDDVVGRLGGHSELLIVTATTAGPAGVASLNQRFHKRAMARVDAGLNQSAQGRFLKGEPVIYGRNDHQAGLVNGLLGRVTDFDFERNVVSVMFDGENRNREIGDEHLHDLELAYAVTCHKCQGSSAARVVIPIYSSRVLDRSWIYTAITRAENQVVLVGDLRVLDEAIRAPAAAETRHIGLRWPPPVERIHL